VQSSTIKIRVSVRRRSLGADSQPKAGSREPPTGFNTAIAPGSEAVALANPFVDGSPWALFGRLPVKTGADLPPCAAERPPGQSGPSSLFARIAFQWIVSIDICLPQ
jgi:hypothetical protein